ncbi:MAG TPA: glycosyltransferase family 2 protein [Candidatus Dojkabacteria bacterium]|nr:glycosyltransferase family 2 protein [Candidatus Dojkabacteria bacterium]
MIENNKKKDSFWKKRQWGSEKTYAPLPSIHPRPSTLKLAMSKIAVIVTVVFWMLYILSIILRQLVEGENSYYFTLEAFGYTLVVSLLIFSALMYLIARQGAFERFSKHVRVPRAILERFFASRQPSITVLVPSYDEEPEVIRKTLLSAALQEYPDLRIVLLIDDKPFPTDPNVLARLNQTRSIPNQIELLLDKPYSRFSNAYAKYQASRKGLKSPNRKIIAEIAKQYKWASDFLYSFAGEQEIDDHVDIFFADQVIKELANDLKLVHDALNSSLKEGAVLSFDRIDPLYQRLLWIFNAKVTYFERKRYMSLSQEANKAMNLNSYIGLMGGTYRPEVTPDGTILTLINDKKAKKDDISVPDSDFLLTLDADSILLRDYCMRLVYFLEQPGNERVAVTQTPYSSFRGALTRIERLAGATTDVQHILHQGMTYYGATFWVGANAVIRKKAIEDIVEKEWIGGFEIKRYIQDRTVIEDTESSIDLGVHGWKLVNYPERLSYSATPPDFGSLVIQRRRWANGGLLIMPKLFNQIDASKKRNNPVPLMEILLRVNYMASIAWASFGLLFMLAYPFDGELLSPLVLLSSAPYFMAMASDLKYNGYKYSDILNIYGFNLILLPVNLAGVLKSMEQALTGKKIPFARTPKVKNRTATGLMYVLVPILIVVFSLYILWQNILLANWGNAIYAAFNAVTAIWAIINYIGIGNLFVDLWQGFVDLLYVDVRNKNEVSDSSEEEYYINWRSVLYHGENSGAVPHASLRDLVLDSVNNKAK